jgi:hypothetical protein
LLVLVGACWCLLVPVVACERLLVLAGACQCLPVPVGACGGRFILPHIPTPPLHSQCCARWATSCVVSSKPGKFCHLFLHAKSTFHHRLMCFQKISIRLAIFVSVDEKLFLSGGTLQTPHICMHQMKQTSLFFRRTSTYLRFPLPIWADVLSILDLIRL